MADGTSANGQDSIPQAAMGFRVETGSPEETARLGERLGELLAAGDVLLLSGELGTGKTCLTQGVAHGLGVLDIVCSPTFVLVGQYEGRLRLYHADLYRLENPAEVEALDLDHSTEDGVLVVEWPERAPECLPREHLLVRLSHAGPQRRTLEWEPRGARAESIANGLMARASSRT